MHKNVALMFDAEAQWSRLHTKGRLDSSSCYCHCVVSSTKNLCSSFLLHLGIKLDISKYINNTGEGSSGCKLCSGLVFHLVGGGGGGGVSNTPFADHLGEKDIHFREV